MSVLWLTTTSIRYHTIDPMPNSHVLKSGVSRFGSMRASLAGAAPCEPIDSMVRVAGRMVVWHDAAAEVSTAMTSSFTMTVGSATLPSA